MPLVPVGNDVIADALVNVPVEATPDTQLIKQPPLAGIFVASMVMLLRFVQP